MTPEEAKELYEKHGSSRKASKAANMPRTSFRRLLKKAEGSKENVKVETDFKGDSGTITTKSLNIKTAEEAAKYAEIDFDKWYIDRSTVSTSEMTVGSKKSGTGKPETYTNYHIKIWVKRKSEKHLSFENLIERLNTQSIETPHRPTPKGEIMMVPSLVDHHFGMLAWGKETGEGDYDLKIAESLYLDAVNEGIDTLKEYEIAKILFPVGSDLFHINSPDNSTPKNNNLLDVDSRLIKVFETGKWAVIKAIERCKQVAPVKIMWIPGNHDPETSYFLCQVIEAFFNNDDDVEVDVGPASRKFEKWGITLLGMTHGSEESVKDLPRIMADSCPEWWACCRHKEWLIGHTHKKKEMSFIGVDTIGSTMVRLLPSLSKIDEWHYSKGYVGGEKAMEVLAYDTKGLKGYFPIYQRNLLDK